MKNEIILFNDSLYDYIENNKNDIINYLKENDIDPTVNNIDDAASDFINFDYVDFIKAIQRYDNTTVYDYIVITGSLGLWYGRRNIKVHFNSLYDAVVSAMQDNNKLYFKRKNCTLSLSAYHHDGENIHQFYKIVKGKKYAIKYNDLIDLF